MNETNKASSRQTTLSVSFYSGWQREMLQEDNRLLFVKESLFHMCVSFVCFCMWAVSMSSQLKARLPLLIYQNVNPWWVILCFNLQAFYLVPFWPSSFTPSNTWTYKTPNKLDHLLPCVIITEVSGYRGVNINLCWTEFNSFPHAREHYKLPGITVLGFGLGCPLAKWSFHLQLRGKGDLDQFV